MLVLDANILIQAVLGNKVLCLIRHAGQVEFWAPDAAFAEARDHLPTILAARGIAAAPALELLGLVSRVVQTLEAEAYCRWLPHMDRGHGLLWLRSGYLDYGPNRAVPDSVGRIPGMLKAAVNASRHQQPRPPENLPEVAAGNLWAIAHELSQPRQC